MNKSRLNRLLLVFLDQLGPDCLPVVGAKFLASDLAGGGFLNRNAQLRTGHFAARENLIEVLLCNAALVCVCKSYGWAEFVHGPYSIVSIDKTQAFR